MAFLRQIVRPKCQHPGCTKYAQFRVVDRWNGERGAFCTKHAENHRAEQERNECHNDGRVRPVLAGADQHVLSPPSAPISSQLLLARDELLSDVHRAREQIARAVTVESVIIDSGHTRSLFQEERDRAAKAEAERRKKHGPHTDEDPEGGYW